MIKSSIAVFMKARLPVEIIGGRINVLPGAGND
jgi:hypothetical protein